MALANDANRVTRDADARFMSHGIVWTRPAQVAANEDVGATGSWRCHNY